jgi:beta-mannanase
VLGVFDPNRRLVDQPAVQVEHLFAKWHTLRNGEFKREFQAVISRHHDVIVTMEPWDGPDQPMDKDVLANTLRGRYDTQLKALYALISNVGQTVYLRWAHEMEIPITRYPWQSQNPLTYIKAYRYVAQFNQERAPNIRMVWGPAGDRGSLDFWPGDDVVDYISIAIYGLPDKNITDHKQQETFRDIFLRKTRRMAFVHKPIFITEFGVKGPDDFQQQWLKGAAQTLREHPEVAGANYFNLQDSPKAWGEIEAPDWSITPAAFSQFAALLHGSAPPPAAGSNLAKAN